MRLFSYFWFWILIIGFQACAPGKEDTSGRAVPETGGNDSVLMLQGLSMPLMMRLDRELISSNGLNQHYNPLLGQIEVNCGNAIQLRISEEMLSLAELKAELLEDQLFKYRFEQESDSQLVYLTILPDGTELSYQYMKLIHLGGKSFLIRSEPMGEYTLQNVELMKTIVATLVAEEA